MSVTITRRVPPQGLIDAINPVVRGLGRRLERLKAGVEQLGGGDLSARVKVEGRDEVAALAASFNRSAQRIEELVAQQLAG